MKKSIFNIALLSMLFVLGACSVKDDGDVTIPGGTGDPTTDAALGDALDQVGSVDGMEIWSFFSNSTPESDLKITEIDNLYLSPIGNEYKQIAVILYDGTSELVGNNFNNEVVGKFTQKGTLTSNSEFTLFTENDEEISVLQGYVFLYKQIATSGEEWKSIKVGGEDKWYDRTDLETSYYVVKKTDTELRMISVKPYNNNNVYNISEADMDTAIANARIFKKK